MGYQGDKDIIIYGKKLLSEEVLGRKDVSKFIEDNNINQKDIQAITVDHNMFTIFYWK